MLALKIGVMSTRLQECQQPPEAEETRTDFSQSFQKECGTADVSIFVPMKLIFDFWTPEL